MAVRWEFHGCKHSSLALAYYGSVARNGRQRDGNSISPRDALVVCVVQCGVDRADGVLSFSASRGVVLVDCPGSRSKAGVCMTVKSSELFSIRFSFVGRLGCYRRVASGKRLAEGFRIGGRGMGVSRGPTGLDLVSW